MNNVSGDYTPIRLLERPCSSMDVWGHINYGTETFYRGGDVVVYIPQPEFSVPEWEFINGEWVENIPF